MPLGFDSEERLAILDGLTVLNIYLDDFARGLGLDFVHQLHGFDDADHRIGLNMAAYAHEAFGRR